MAQQRIPNIRLRSWRDGAHMTRAESADAINRSTAGQARKLYCDEERIRRWEAGEVLWPSSDYRKALCEVTDLDAKDLGFLPPYAQDRHVLVTVNPVSVDALATEREIFSTMELARLLDDADIGPGTLEALEEATDLLCRAYPRLPVSSSMLASRNALNMSSIYLVGVSQ